IFMAIIDKRIPPYRGNSSAIALDTSRPNPGLGFRPQISVQKVLIKYRSSHRDTFDYRHGWGEYKEQLDEFLAYYTEADIRYQRAIDCNGISIDKLRPQFYEEPITYQNAAEVPEQFKAIWESEFSDYILVECNGENDVDRDFIYEIEYFSQMNTTKIVFVHFKKIETNVLINVECRAYARNIDHNDSLEFIRGSVHFELIVE
ncbi:unnamed protein product, partial [Rotaria sp. Silwood1]